MGQIPLLTPRQREILIGLSERPPGGSSEGNERTHRTRIRERAHNSILEFPFFLQTLPREDRRQIFEDLRQLPGHRPPDRDLEEGSLNDDVAPGEMMEYGVIGILAFLYAGVDDSTEFEVLLEQAIGAARNVDGQVPVDVTVEISLERTPGANRVGEEYGASPLDPPTDSDEEEATLEWGIKNLRQRLSNRARRKGIAEGQMQAREEMLEELDLDEDRPEE